MPASAESVADTRSRIHQAAIDLFTTQGYHGTGMREIAKTAGVSLGNLYNHHAAKEDLFASILDEFEARYTAPDTPLARAFADFESLDDLEAIGDASRRMVAEFADYIRLIYVDVVELEGGHIRRLFGGMRRRYEEVFSERLETMRRRGELGRVDPVAALMTATIAFFYYFNMERVFGVRRLFGVGDAEAVALMARTFREGMRPR
ncbi:MAG: TetR/AcrR family transcriptional regulator [Planctomycetes bacterium]|nr:TetR/AcrR family transcriptional regulator [Planctomycetota bacterium]